jgi:hypothetical protein
VQALQHQHSELQNHIQRWAPALRPPTTASRAFQDWPEPFEIDRGIQSLQRITSGGNLRKPIFDIPEPQLLRHIHLPLTSLSQNQ